jgi:integrase/recombinase XerD
MGDQVNRTAIEVVGIMLSPESYLFPGRKPDSHLTRRQVQHWFSEILKLADIDQREKNRFERGACLHCFRHVFVLKSMQQLEAAEHPVDMNDLLLPTYLGHECLLDTDKYMRFSGAQIPDSLVSAPVIKCKKTPVKKCRFATEKM